MEKQGYTTKEEFGAEFLAALDGGIKILTGETPKKNDIHEKIEYWKKLAEGTSDDE
jgi:hypothetical protein